MKLASLIVLVAMLAGCANQPVPFADGQPVPKERLYSHTAVDSCALLVTRDSGLIGVALNTDLYIDGVLAGSFESGEAAKFWVPAGDHILSVKGLGATTSERVFATAQGAQTKLRIVVNMGVIDIMPTAF